jgi:hypothetical protein
MKKKNLLIKLTTYLPAIIMIILAFLSFSNILDETFRKGLIINSLILYYPSLFFLQGIVTAFINANVYVNVGLSLLVYIFILLVWLNSSALIYIVIYLISFFLGYWVIKMFKNRYK